MRYLLLFFLIAVQTAVFGYTNTSQQENNTQKILTSEKSDLNVRSYHFFRYYSPESGTYVSQDPIRLNGGDAFYAYVHNANSWLDPFGLSGRPKVFWSGGPKAQAAAREYAEEIGGEILEMTPQGQAMEKWTKDMDWAEAEPLWKKTSQSFAGSAPKSQKHAVVFIDSSRYRGASSVWESTEKPIIEKKGMTSEVRDVNKVKACH